MGFETMCWLCWEEELWIACTEEEAKEETEKRHYCKRCINKTLPQQISIKNRQLRRTEYELNMYEGNITKGQGDKITKVFYRESKRNVKRLKKEIKELRKEQEQQENR